MKKTKPPTLTAKDLANIRALILTECAPLNRENRRRLRELEKENAKLRQQKKEMPHVIKYLLGEGPLAGQYYGDPAPGMAPYWWRTELRKLYEK